MGLIPHLQANDILPMAVSNSRHIDNAGVVGFSGARDHGGIIKDFRGQTGSGTEISEIGRKIGADAVIRSGSLGAAGLNRVDNASFSDVMLRAIDKVSGDQNRAAALSEAAITDPSSVDIHDLTIAEAEATMSLSIARTLLSRLTQAWRDVINTR
ncbi:MAG: flagellar hook-basal body complex protein FliE [Spirochaetaceae bacterium]|jgi:flagellar hook-basal body complex protein FliE|nr:flagellar hook-basal body complex protein FliE [Spirochaetaceae bacterium]